MPLATRTFPMFPTDVRQAVSVLVPTLVPAMWWAVETRRLLSRLDDPLLPERLLAARRRASGALFCSVGVVAAVKVSAIWWAVPLMLLARAAVGFSLRRRLYEERWSFGTMVSMSARLLLGVYGFHIALIALPIVFADSFQSHARVAAIGLAMGLLAWNVLYAPILRSCLGTRPVTDPVLVEAFSALVSRTHIEPPRFEYVDMRGGALTNAVALASLRRSSVVFTSPLLERLQTDEIVAITAHEIAHLEYYSPKRLRRLRAIQWTAILVGALGVVLWPPAWPDWARNVCWMVLAAAALGWNSRKRQQNETDSDRRAVELSGSADALARGLTKLYTFARLPRRWDASFEQNATHPSLPRRIRDIYAAGGVTPAAIEAPVQFSDADGQTNVTFAQDGVHWAAPGASHHLGYDALSELRVVAQRSGEARLVAADRSGRRWQMQLSATDVARAQSVLDSVDARVAIGSGPSRASAVPRLLALIAMLAALVTTQFGCALVAFVSAAVPTRRMLAATAAACVAAASIALSQGRAEATTLLLFGVAAGGLAMTVKRDFRAPREGLALTTLAVAAALGVLLLLDYGITVFRLHQAARALPGAAILILATGVALRVSAIRRPARYAADLLAIAGVALAYTGSAAFLDGFVRDPLLVRAPQLRTVRISATPISAVDAPFDAAAITLSPRGDRIILWRDSDDVGSAPDDDWTAQVGAPAGPFSKVTADDAVFAPDGGLVSVRFTSDGAEIRKDATAGEAAWSTRTPAIATGQLIVAADGRHWMLVGWDTRQQPVEATGTIGTPDVKIQRWPGAPGVSYVNLAAADASATVVEQHYRPSRVTRTLAAWGLALPLGTDTRIWKLDANGRSLVADSQLEISCSGAAVHGALVCAAYDGTRTRLAAIAVSTGNILPLAVAPDILAPSAEHASAGWLSAWGARAPSAIDINALTAFQLPRSPGRSVIEMSGAGNRVAAVEWMGDRSRVAIYSLDGLRTPSK